ncbi:hypothetical protein [Rhizobium leguminosarum]|nr:hypothetical protein [Rhizobium leguminosarum]
MRYQIYEDGHPTGLVYNDCRVAKAIARDMEREGSKRLEVRPA